MKKRFVLAILVGLTIIGIVLVSNGFRPTDASTQGVTSELEVELITLRPAGFEPREITRPKGVFVLFIDDRSGRENSSLVLQRVHEEPVRDVGLNREKSEWHDVIDLAPGNYVLRDLSNPELRCQITILP